VTLLDGRALNFTLPEERLRVTKMSSFSTYIHQFHLNYRCRVEAPVTLPDGRTLSFTLPEERLRVTTRQSFWWAVEATAAAGRLQNVAVRDDGPQYVPGWPGLLQSTSQMAKAEAAPYDLSG